MSAFVVVLAATRRVIVGCPLNGAALLTLCTAQDVRRQYSQRAKMPVLGYIGLGQMGHHMAGNLINAAKGKFESLLIHDTDAESIRRFQVAHGTAAKTTAVRSPADVARGADVVFTMLPASKHVRAVYLDGPHSLMAGAKRGMLFIDTSTIDADTIAHVARAMEAQSGAVAIDAPVSGGVGGAKNATLTFMVGGSEAAFAQAAPWLKSMGKNIVHCGQVGKGQVAKICNNMLLGTTMIATCEALHLAVQNGMDPKLMSQIINMSSGRSWSSETYNPVPGVVEGLPASNGYEGGFAIALMQKDMGLAIDSAQKANASVTLSAAAGQMFKQVMNTPGLERKDFSVVYAWLAQQVASIKK